MQHIFKHTNCRIQHKLFVDNNSSQAVNISSRASKWSNLLLSVRLPSLWSQPISYKLPMSPSPGHPCLVCIISVFCFFFFFQSVIPCLFESFPFDSQEHPLDLAKPISCNSKVLALRTIASVNSF